MKEADIRQLAASMLAEIAPEADYPRLFTLRGVIACLTR
jgi:hypothetical protein